MFLTLLNLLCTQLATALRRGPYQTNVLLAGYDTTKEGSKVSLYHMDYLAALTEVKFGAHGYCSNFILSIFDRDWQPNMSLEQALEVVRKCLYELKVRFLISQPNFVIKLVDAQGTRVLQL
ncbi:hypothetical protein EON65_41565 [archaeon]|nr:MAG: hypothetical protein EON65_41565 [archaeon]